VRGAAALDQPAGRVDLVGAVHSQVEAVQLVERVDPQAELSSRALRRERGGDAADEQPPLRHRRQEVRHGGARPEPEEHAVLD
jgi:hypothetical protein